MQKQYGEDSILDPKETSKIDLKSMDLAVHAIFVNKNGGAGVVTSNNVVIEPKQKTRYIIIIFKSDLQNLTIWNKLFLRFLLPIKNSLAI